MSKNQEMLQKRIKSASHKFDELLRGVYTFTKSSFNSSTEEMKKKHHSNIISLYRELQAELDNLDGHIGVISEKFQNQYTQMRLQQEQEKQDPMDLDD